jgi:pimeloyl-ACP methyl ester carboxylesterase
LFIEFDLPAGPVSLRLLVGPPNGAPLVLFHGVGRRGTDFLPIVPALATRWHLHLVDHRGHGGSGRAAGRYQVTDHVEDALSVLNWLGRPAVLFGHSLGALTVAGAAAAKSELVQAVILEDPPSAAFLRRLPETPYHATFTAMRRLAGSTRPVTDVARELGETPVPFAAGRVPLSALRDGCALRFVARCLRDVDPDVFTPPLEGTWLDGYDERSIWRRVTCPALLLRGDPGSGGMLPQPDADLMFLDVPDLTAIDVPGVGHLVHGLAAELTVRYVLNFLEAL